MSTPPTLLFVGDSITDCGRRDQHAPLGNGYVALVADMLKLQAPKSPLRVLNRGIAGNTIEDLYSRWTDHVICESPDYLVIKIGINDCNRYVTDATKELQSPQKYAEYFDQLLSHTHEALPQCKILVVSPFYLSKDDNAPGAYRARVRLELEKYLSAAKAAAEKHDAAYCDLQSGFNQLLESLTPCELADDAVHPNRIGTLFIAQHVFTALRDVIEI